MCYESYFLADRFQQITTDETTDSTVLNLNRNLIFYNFSKPVKCWGQQSSTESSDVEKKMVVEVLKSPKGRKRKMKQSKIEIHGEKKKLVVKLPASDSSSPGSGPKCTSSPVVIDLDSSDSAKVLAVVAVVDKLETVLNASWNRHLQVHLLRNIKARKI